MPFTNSIDPANPSVLPVKPGGSQQFRFSAAPGLYQLSVILDAREFDWESLYENLARFDNSGQRTGPWDFKLGPSHPLVPAYWVTLDGKRTGLWYFQRVSVEDIERRLFRGRTAFHIRQGGEHELHLEPYRPMKVRWVSAALERDPDDRLMPLPEGLRPAPGNVPASTWADSEFWADQRQRLATTHRPYAEPLRAVFDWASSHGTEADVRRLPFLDVPILVAASRLHGTSDPIEQALGLVDKAIDMPHWGNPKEDAYGHNGDMGAALLMRAMAWAYHLIGPDLGDERRARLADKLVLQGNRFVDLALLNRDYWGGSLLQDHGWRSLWSFGTAALHLYGVMPEAAEWLTFVMPRLQRSLDAMPEDGVVPPSSHFMPFLYLFDPTQYRDTLVAMGGPDIFDDAPFHAVIEYLDKSSCPRDHQGQPAPRNADQLLGPAPFIARMATKYRDRCAAWLHEQTLVCADVPAALRGRLGTAAAHGLLWGLMAYEPGVEPALEEGQIRARRRFSHFKDSALVHYYDTHDGITLSLQCGPPNGYRAYRNARGPCDRLATPPRLGHFELSIDQTPLLASPLGGYRMHTFLGNVLLVDDQGQINDVGYPMSLPSWRDHGAEIVLAEWDEAAQTGRVRLDLAPAYPAGLAMALYLRDLLIESGNRIICRDRVVFAEPHRLSWLFHARRDVGLRLETGLRCRFGSDPRVWLEPRVRDLELVPSIRETDVVYSYVPVRPKFDHVRYDTAAPVAAATADFVIEW